jgi:hypothetical protein
MWITPVCREKLSTFASKAVDNSRFFVDKYVDNSSTYPHLKKICG